MSLKNKTNCRRILVGTRKGHWVVNDIFDIIKIPVQMRLTLQFFRVLLSCDSNKFKVTTLNEAWGFPFPITKSMGSAKIWRDQNIRFLFTTMFRFWPLVQIYHLFLKVAKHKLYSFTIVSPVMIPWHTQWEKRCV